MIFTKKSSTSLNVKNDNRKAKNNRNIRQVQSMSVDRLGVTNSHARGNLGHVARKLEEIREMAFMAKKQLDIKKNKDPDQMTNVQSLLTRNQQSMPDLLSKKIKLARSSVSIDDLQSSSKPETMMDIKLASIYKNSQKDKKQINQNKKAFKDLDNISNAASSMESVEPIFVKESSIFDNLMMVSGGSDLFNHATDKTPQNLQQNQKTTNQSVTKHLKIKKLRKPPTAQSNNSIGLHSEIKRNIQSNQIKERTPSRHGSDTTLLMNKEDSATTPKKLLFKVNMQQGHNSRQSFEKKQESLMMSNDKTDELTQQKSAQIVPLEVNSILHTDSSMEDQQQPKIISAFQHTKLYSKELVPVQEIEPQVENVFQLGSKADRIMAIYRQRKLEKGEPQKSEAANQQRLDQNNTSTHFTNLSKMHHSKQVGNKSQYFNNMRHDIGKHQIEPTELFRKKQELKNQRNLSYSSSTKTMVMNRFPAAVQFRDRLVSVEEKKSLRDQKLCLEKIDDLLNNAHELRNSHKNNNGGRRSTNDLLNKQPGKQQNKSKVKQGASKKAIKAAKELLEDSSESYKVDAENAGMQGLYEDYLIDLKDLELPKSKVKTSGKNKKLMAGAKGSQSQTDFMELDLSQMINYDNAKDTVLASISQQKLWKNKFSNKKAVTDSQNLDCETQQNLKQSTSPKHGKRGEYGNKKKLPLEVSGSPKSIGSRKDQLLKLTSRKSNDGNHLSMRKIEEEKPNNVDHGMRSTISSQLMPKMSYGPYNAAATEQQSKKVKSMIQNFDKQLTPRSKKQNSLLLASVSRKWPPRRHPMHSSMVIPNNQAIGGAGHDRHQSYVPLLSDSRHLTIGDKTVDQEQERVSTITRMSQGEKMRQNSKLRFNLREHRDSLVKHSASAMAIGGRDVTGTQPLLHLQPQLAEQEGKANKQQKMAIVENGEQFNLFVQPLVSGGYEGGLTQEQKLDTQLKENINFSTFGSKDQQQTTSENANFQNVCDSNQETSAMVSTKLLSPAKKTSEKAEPINKIKLESILNQKTFQQEQNNSMDEKDTRQRYYKQNSTPSNSQIEKTEPDLDQLKELLDKNIRCAENLKQKLIRRTTIDQLVPVQTGTMSLKKSTSYSPWSPYNPQLLQQNVSMRPALTAIGYSKGNDNGKQNRGSEQMLKSQCQDHLPQSLTASQSHAGALTIEQKYSRLSDSDQQQHSQSPKVLNGGTKNALNQYVTQKQVADVLQHKRTDHEIRRKKSRTGSSSRRVHDSSHGPQCTCQKQQTNKAGHMIDTREHRRKVMINNIQVFSRQNNKSQQSMQSNSGLDKLKIVAKSSPCYEKKKIIVSRNGDGFAGTSISGGASATVAAAPKQHLNLILKQAHIGRKLPNLYQIQETATIGRNRNMVVLGQSHKNSSEEKNVNNVAQNKSVLTHKSISRNSFKPLNQDGSLPVVFSSHTPTQNKISEQGKLQQLRSRIKAVTNQFEQASADSVININLMTSTPQKKQQSMENAELFMQNTDQTLRQKYSVDSQTHESMPYSNQQQAQITQEGSINRNNQQFIVNNSTSTQQLVAPIRINEFSQIATDTSPKVNILLQLFNRSEVNDAEQFTSQEVQNNGTSPSMLPSNNAAIYFTQDTQAAHHNALSRMRLTNPNSSNGQDSEQTKNRNRGLPQLINLEKKQAAGMAVCIASLNNQSSPLNSQKNLDNQSSPKKKFTTQDSMTSNQTTTTKMKHEKRLLALNQDFVGIIEPNSNNQQASVTYNNKQQQHDQQNTVSSPQLYQSSEKQQTNTLEQLQMRLTPNTFGLMGHSLANSNRKKLNKSKQVQSQTSIEGTESPYVNQGDPQQQVILKVSSKTPVKKQRTVVSLKVNNQTPTQVEAPITIAQGQKEIYLEEGEDYTIEKETEKLADSQRSSKLTTSSQQQLKLVTPLQIRSDGQVMLRGPTSQGRDNNENHYKGPHTLISSTSSENGSRREHQTRVVGKSQSMLQIAILSSSHMTDQTELDTKRQQVREVESSGAME